MIGWKCKYGYYPKTLGDIDGGNYSDIVFTDNGIFSLITNGNLSNISVFTGDVNVNHDSPKYSDSQTTELLINSFADDFYTIYLNPQPNRTSYSVTKESMERIIPSMFMMCPNLAELVYSNENQILGYIVCEIPGLNRILAYQASIGTGAFYLDKNGDKLTRHSFTKSGRNYIEWNTQWSRYFVFQICLGYDGSKDSLLEPRNYSLLLGAKYDSYSYQGYVGVYQVANGGESVIATATEILNYFWGDFSPPDADTPDNPYEPGGPSGPGGGDGTFDDDSDQIGLPSLPTLSSANTGFTRIYNPTLAQVQQLARYLWTDDSVIETIWNHIKQFFENPMEAIIGFNLVPVPVPDGGTENFKLMYIDTGVAMTVAANQFVDIDCGTLELKPYYGSALDYSPYTKISCFLPFIGNVSLNVDEVMGRTLQVKYRVDICSGACVAYILVDGNAIYQYSGHCAIPIPLAAADFSTYVSTAISAAKLAGAALIAGAGALAGTSAADAVQQTNQIVTTTQTVNTARNPSTGRQITTGTVTTTQTRELPTKDQSSTEASFAGMTPQNVANTVGAIMSSKPHIEHSGSFSGNSGYLGVRRPFVIIERPNMCMPGSFQALNGYPSMITLSLESCKGFTRVQQVQLTGFYATNPEQAEILQLLKSGVIL